MGRVLIDVKNSHIHEAIVLIYKFDEAKESLNGERKIMAKLSLATR